MAKKFDIRVFMASVMREAGEDAGRSFSPAALRHLLRRKDEDFVRQAYWQILGRDVDPDGLAGYAPRCGSYMGRMTVLAALLLSPEKLLLPDWLRQGLKTLAKPLQRQRKD